MGHDNSALQSELAATYNLYAALLRSGQSLGGKLLYAGELTEESSRMVRAANIAGAATLTVTADKTMQRAAIREGIADFLVTSLDEALRILKNEIRKHQAVAVCVGAAQEAVEAEMRERGVRPDLTPPIATGPLPPDQIFVVIPEPPAGFESRAQALIPESDQLTRRWLHLSPRYLGPQARKLRSLACGRVIAEKLTAKS